MIKYKLIAIVAISLSIVGCATPLTDYLNKKYPPISVDTQKQEAHNAAIQSANKMGSPNLAFGSHFDQLERALLNDELKKEGIRDIKIDSDGQLLKFNIEFKRVAEGLPLLDQFKPEVTGNLEAYLGVGTEISDDTLEIKLIPAVSRFHIHKVVIKGDYDLTALGEKVASFLTTYAENITGAIASHPSMTAQTLASWSDNQAISERMHFNRDGVKASVQVTGTATKREIKLKGIAPIVMSDELFVLAEFESPNPSVKTTIVSTGKDDGTDIQKTAMTLLDKGFGLKQIPSDTWFIMRKDLMSETLNMGLNGLQACINATSPIPRETFNEKIDIPDEKTIDCKSNRICSSNRDCSNISKSHDDRDCKRCANVPCPTWSKPFRTCRKCINEPVCESAKAVQNAAYEVDYNARKFDCNRIREQEIATCKVEMATEKFLCESGRELVKRISRTGNFARVEGSVQGKASVNACLKNIAFSNDLSKLQAQLDVSGLGNMDTRLKFTPLDIVGHLTCQVPWKDSETFKLRLPSQTINIDTSMTLEDTEKGPVYKVNLDASKVNMKLTPTPAYYMATNEQFMLSCAGAGLINTLAIGGSSFIPELRGEIEQDIPTTTARFPIADLELTVGKKRVPIKVSDVGDSIQASGDLK